MSDIVLTTFNARYSHASFGLRYLLANMGDLRACSQMLEFDIRVRTADAVAAILACEPRIVGVGVYIWNATPATALVAALKAAKPGLIVIVGGPEVSYEIDQQEICRAADYVVTGEADFTFARLCADLLDGRAPKDRVVFSEPVDVQRLVLPYALYSDTDIAQRVIYVEASRGCPFTCEFCLSSLDIPLRRFPLEPLLAEFQTLLDRGVREFKFVDRTFNLSIPYSLKLLEFFLARYRPGLFLHFEMIPDRLPTELRDIITCFPPGSLQFEVGVQTFNKSVAERIRRKQNYEKTVDNIRFLLDETKSYIHADLIFGLPGESWESFAEGFDRLVALRPQEIQVNILKRLRGTPITRHDTEWQVEYSPDPPYDVLHNRDLDDAAMTRLRHFARYWDLYANSGNFLESAPMIWRGGSPFHEFMAFSEWMYERTGRTHALALDALAEHLFTFLAGRPGADQQVLAESIWRDYSRGAQRNVPRFLKSFIARKSGARTASEGRLKRQARRTLVTE
jgi:radical SAM superfamily enzyme YgiQ (UPF0313 family)